MAEAALRTLERAFTSGEESARLPLASAYLRQGHPELATALLDAGPGLSREGAALQAAAWQARLAGLRPAAAVPALQRWGPLLGFFGGDRYAALGGIVGPRLLLADLALGREVSAGWRHLQSAGQLPQAEPVLVTSSGLLCHWPWGGWFWLVAPLEAEREFVQPVAQAAALEPGRQVRVAPDERQALIGRRVVTLPDLQPVQRIPDSAVAWDVDFPRGQIAWWSQGRVFTAPLGQPEAPPRVLDPGRLLAAAQPVRAAALGVGAGGEPPGTFTFLADGRLCLGPPLAVLELESGRAWLPPPLPGWSGPLELGRDGQGLLLFQAGAPRRLPLDGGELPAPLPPPAGAPGEWHPRAPLAALPRGPLGLPQLRSALGETLCTFPSDARPLGWTRDGLGLLLLRQAGADRGTLELWRAGGTT